MEGSNQEFCLKSIKDSNFSISNLQKVAINSLSNISDMSKEIKGGNDSSLDNLAQELFCDDSNSNQYSSSKKKNQNLLPMKNESLALEYIEEAQINQDFSEYSGLADFIDKTLTKSNKNIKQAIAGRPDKENVGNNNSISFIEFADEFQKCKNVNMIFRKLNKAFSMKINKDCLKISESLLEIQDTMKNLESYSQKYQEMKNIISLNDLKSLMSCLTKKIPTLSSLVNTCACRIKEIENAGDTAFEEFQQKCMKINKDINLESSLIPKEMYPVHSGLETLDEAGCKFKNPLIDDSKMLWKYENENKVIKLYYKRALANIKKELSEILTSDRSFHKVSSKVNRSDSVHINPAFGENSGRLNAHSQNSFTGQENILEIEAERDTMNINPLNLHNYQPFNNRNENSGTTGGNDDPPLKFTTLLRKSEEMKISAETIKRLHKLKELVLKYEKITMNDMTIKQKALETNKEVNFNQTFSQDSVSQAIQSFFGQSEVKDNFDFLKESSFTQTKDIDIGFPKELEVLKEIKEEIKEESLRRKQEKKLNDKNCEFDKENCNFSQISEIKDACNEVRLNKTSPEPEMYLNTEEQNEIDVKYLTYVEEMHEKINSKQFYGLEPEVNGSPSEIYSENRLHSSSSEKMESARKIEDPEGNLFVITEAAGGQTVQIPHLNLGRIIKKQKRKMYPFNINTNGELIEVTNKESSLDTFNDEDAMIIYDEKDQEDAKSLDLDNEDPKHSNLFNSSFFSDLSSVHKVKNNDEAQIQIERDFEDFLKTDNERSRMHLDEEESHMNNHNSFLDQELNIDSVHFDHSNITKNTGLIKIQGCANKNMVESSLGIFDDETGRFCDEKEKSSQKDQETSEKDSSKFCNVKLSNFVTYGDSLESRKLQEKSSSKSILASQKYHNNYVQSQCKTEESITQSALEAPQKVTRDPTFGKEDNDSQCPSAVVENYEEFEKSIMEKHICQYTEEEESKIRNKSVVIPRSSILLKNKKNVKKCKEDKERTIKNNSVSPSRIMLNSNLKLTQAGTENEGPKDQIKYKSLKNYNKGRINFKSSKILTGDNSMNCLNESLNKRTSKLVKHKKKDSISNIDLNIKKENSRKSLQNGAKPSINIQKVKIMKSNLNQDFKMKGRKLNLRFKDFSKNEQNRAKLKTRADPSKNLKVNKTVPHKPYSGQKVQSKPIGKENKSFKSGINQISCEEVKPFSNSSIPVPQKCEKKVSSNLFQVNKRRFPK
ncbi:unnamed protein product [Moneuplotes crassus]|uniref:Uncharacterized protein n=1 Tax=Euplotes crassus TaxID=5936 RepID=A0AAD1UGR3_EUPCR|nr:unnamed protein product [Moneuplotes crassus]